MKSFVCAIFFLAIVNGAYSECSEEGKKIIKECYANYLKEVPLTTSPNSLKLADLTSLTDADYQKMEKAFAEKKKCIAGYENECLNIEAFSRAFGASYNDTLVFLFLDFTLDYMDNIDPKATKEESKCFSTVSFEGKCPPPKGCLGLEKYVDCAKDLFIKKCDNEEVAQVFRDALLYAFKKVLPVCG